MLDFIAELKLIKYQVSTQKGIFFQCSRVVFWGGLMLATTQSQEVRSASMNNSEVSSWQQ